MAENSAEPSKDSLGLDLDSLKISDDQTKTTPAEKTDDHQPTEQSEQSQPQPTAASDAPVEPEKTEHSETVDAAAEPGVEAASEDKKQPPPPPREKKKPYVNPERVLTGGAQRTKLSEDDLAQRMARIREQNEKIKLRRADVEADEQEFKKTQEADRQKQARDKKVQASVNNAREQNARRKLEKIQNREWDSGKPGVKAAASEPPSNPANQPPLQTASIGIRGGVRGGGGGRGRGRGRGRGGGPGPNASAQSPVTSPTEEKSAETPVSTPAPAVAPTADTASA